MFHKIFKLIISVGLLVWAVMQFIDGEIGNGIAICLLAGVFVFLYFKNEFLIIAFFQMRRQNMEGAAKWLSYIKNPKTSLTKSQEAYYYFLHGLIATRSNNINKAERDLRKALNMGLKMNHNIAMAKLNLAGIAIKRRRNREATQLITQAKKLDKYGMLKEQIAMMKQRMKQPTARFKNR